VPMYGCGHSTPPPRATSPNTAPPPTTTTAAAIPAPGPRVQVGLERIGGDANLTLRGKAIGLIANAASVTWDGRTALDVLRKDGIHVVRLFAPEHGLTGRLGAGITVSGGIDRADRIKVVSLYGNHNKPTAQDLKGLDALVFDLQDVGVRFYTYISTMILAEDAAAAARIPFVVLDRPNPLGGDRIEGPTSTLPRSLVNTAPGPLVYGLTAGEMARFVNGLRRTPARVIVVPMTGWKRSMTWADTGRRWIPPSPNLLTPDAALLYPGAALVEATNITEGRGTPAPFHTVGAPWLKVPALMHRLSMPGVHITPISFTPHGSLAAPTPKYVGQVCAGIRLTVVDPASDFYRAGVALLHALREQPGFQLLDGGTALDTLVGTPRLRIALERGQAVNAIVASDSGAIARWRQQRRSALLY
jgi:uncharacterized protein YbbC (DUF1343 family)